MEQTCTHHPGTMAASTCRHCGRPFCADCLTEGAEFYFCNALECQQALRGERLPAHLICPVCGDEITLTDEEQRRKRFVCSGCDRVIETTDDQAEKTGFRVLSSDSPPSFFAISPTKLVVMSLATGAFYQIYWFYRHWKQIQICGRSGIMPGWRAVFALFFYPGLLLEVKQACDRRHVPYAFTIGSATALWITSWILYTVYINKEMFSNQHVQIDFSWPVGLFGLDGIVAACVGLAGLVPMQRAANELVAKGSPNAEINSRFSPWNIAGIVFGSALHVLSAYVMFK